jgi:hypothetical protein
MTKILQKPQPRVNSLTEPFWEAINREGKLLIQKCQEGVCGKYIFYPRVCCPFCQSSKLQWVPAKGTGVILSNTTIHRPHHEGFIAECPYAFAAVELTEGPCIYTTLLGAPLDVSLVGRRVTMKPEQHGSNQKIPIFTLV